MRFDVGERSTIKVLEDDFDRSICEHSADWTTKKQLKLDTVFYAGEQLKIIEYK